MHISLKVDYSSMEHGSEKNSEKNVNTHALANGLCIGCRP